MRRREIERKISGFEERLDVKFPESYRQFLLEKGSAVIDGYQIFGLPEKEEKKGGKRKWDAITF